MYHTIEEFLQKIDVINEKADVLRLHISAVNLGFEEPDPAIIQYEIDDLRALCADIANDSGSDEIY